MLIVCFEAKGAVHHEFLPEGQTATYAFFGEVQKQLKGRVNRVTSGIVADWNLHHDNASRQPHLLRSQRLPGTERYRRPPGAPVDFFLLPLVNTVLKGHCHGTLSEVKTA